jgi:hypothetical protein
VAVKFLFFLFGAGVSRKFKFTERRNSKEPSINFAKQKTSTLVLCDMIHHEQYLKVNTLTNRDKNHIQLGCNDYCTMRFLFDLLPFFPE